MKLILEFWGDRDDLPMAEFRGIMEGEGKDYRIVNVDYPVGIVDAEDFSPMHRAGLLRRVSKHIYSGKEIPNLKMQLENYAIRVRGGGSEEIIPVLARGIKGRVNLKNSKNLVVVYRGEKFHVGLEIMHLESENFESRRSKNLPISYPITMHPRLARFMVNLARVKNGDKILDPFCGTGSILIEAGLVGMKIYGSDIKLRMIEAARTNLGKFGLQAELEIKDVGNINGHYDAIVTDPPYGRSSSTGGEEIYELYSRAFESFSRVTNKVVIALPDESAIKIGQRFFDLKELYPYRVHRFLTRYFAYFHA